MILYLKLKSYKYSRHVFNKGKIIKIVNLFTLKIRNSFLINIENKKTIYLSKVKN